MLLSNLLEDRRDLLSLQQALIDALPDDGYHVSLLNGIVKVVNPLGREFFVRPSEKPNECLLMASTGSSSMLINIANLVRAVTNLKMSEAGYRALTHDVEWLKSQMNKPMTDRRELIALQQRLVDMLPDDFVVKLSTTTSSDKIRFADECVLVIIPDGDDRVAATVKINHLAAAKHALEYNVTMYRGKAGQKFDDYEHISGGAASYPEDSLSYLVRDLIDYIHLP